MEFYRFLADVVAIVHFAYAAFVVLGMVAILLGIALGWRWIRNFWFRIVHLATIGIVVVESLVGVTCPLTDLENYLRVQGGEAASSATFIGRCVQAVLFYRFPEWVFTTVYCLFGAAVLLTLFLAPPRRPGAAKQTIRPEDRKNGHFESPERRGL